jgi:outer membrane protein assembly factor BamB
VPLERAWSADLGLVQRWALLTAGRVFAHTRDGRGHLLLALDVRSGQEVWRRYSTSSSVDVGGSPGRLFMADAGTVALDAASGRELWRSREEGGRHVIAGDRLLMDGHFEVVALSAAEGATLWRTRTPYSDGRVTVGGGIVARAGGCAVADGVELLTGSPAWHHFEGCSGHARDGAAFDGTVLWMGSRLHADRGRAFDMRTGAVVARFSGSTPALAPPLGYRLQSGQLMAFDLRSLEVRWTLPLGSDRASAPLVVDDLVFVAAGSDVVAADRTTGTVRWSARLGHPIVCCEEPRVAAGARHLVIPTEGGLEVFRAPDSADSGPSEDDPRPPDPGGTTDAPDSARPTDDPTPDDESTAGPLADGSRDATQPSPTVTGPQPGGSPRARTRLRARANLRGRRLVLRACTRPSATGRIRISFLSRLRWRSLHDGCLRFTFRLKARDVERLAGLRLRYLGDADHRPVSRILRIRRLP